MSTTFVVIQFLFSLAITDGIEPEKAIITNLQILVIDEVSGEPMPAAKIKIEQNNLEAYTDLDGLVIFNELPAGTYNIEISFISYRKQYFKAFALNVLNNNLLVKLNQ